MNIYENYEDFENSENEKKYMIFIKAIVQAITVVALAWFCINSFAQMHTFVGQSMQPSMYDGDMVLYNRVVYDVSPPERFDVVLFETSEGKLDIKRIVALPTETIQIVDGRVLIDGQHLVDERIATDISLAGLASMPITLTEGEYFVLGDNVEASQDSRFDTIGNIQASRIIGKVWIDIWPLGHMRFY